MSTTSTTVRVTFRLPESLRAAAERAAGVEGLPAYIRRLISEATGTPIDPMPLGAQALPEDERRENARKGGAKSRRGPSRQ